ncbi:thiol:disulfide interchange protein DsbA [Natronospira proteinivora]|uniref:Thiol:disulfide interchange protein n=1 Tax=Natronospira proteinivora TaxID=1807133 RepID=A0ABT1GA04_9GAMM|nr:thiol:disulfide interchange protein DsbA/DsbL [Natronospira proteinivora]MCP1728145.1 thiol:disulfide interchange protein DsbA [Natronospira proteinivora]
MFKNSLSLIAALFLLPSLAMAQSYQEDTHYQIADREHRFSDQPKEVVEFFWYGCGGCYAFLPAAEEWKDSLPDDVAFVRVPAVLNPQWRTHGKAFYVAEALDMVDDIHGAMFTALHEERRQINDEDSMREFFVEQGADPEAFDEAFNSFEVDSKLRRAENLARRFSIRSTPSLVINGRYVTDLSNAGGVDGMVELGNWLLERD